VVAVRGKRHRERRRRSVYMSSTAVCAAQMGVNFRQSSGTVWVEIWIATNNANNSNNINKTDTNTKTLTNTNKANKIKSKQ